MLTVKDIKELIQKDINWHAAHIKRREKLGKISVEILDIHGAHLALKGLLREIEEMENDRA